MVSQLLSPNQPKNLSDFLVLATLGLHILLLWVLPSPLRVSAFGVIFLFWRAGYNLGIGYLLHVQSRHRRLVAWAKKSKIFVDPNLEENPRPYLHHILKQELETKIPKDYDFDKAPVEYNTWLVFRRLVDLILMCDFVSYCLFAVACGSRPADEATSMLILRWVTGIGLFGFNLWVKLDAHRVVKDYAWYWGDFFYLIDQELTFDGVFEMAPHPMYSVGYAGYYGISLMAASHKVLFISIIAHAAQFAFLIWVENPHIEKTYNSPPPRKQLSESEVDLEYLNAVKGEHETNGSPLPPTTSPFPLYKLMGVGSIDFYRATDTSVMLLALCLAALTLATPSTPFYQLLFAINAAIWRVWYSVGVGFLLNRQSSKKRWTRHFLKYGESTEEAWRQWKGTYRLSLTLCYASFLAACWKMYTLPADWNHRLVLLKHIVGISLVALQIWTAISIFESLGDFGWYFGDFFFDQSPKLTYSGIYRYLNNPERVIGLAGVWGAVLITDSSYIFFLALLSHILTLTFIQFVERPHMQKLYGQSLREESGLVKSLKRSLPPPLQKWQGHVDKILAETLDFVEDFMDVARPRIEADIHQIVKDFTARFKKPTRISITRLAPDLDGLDPRDYSVEIVDASSDTACNPREWDHCLGHAACAASTARSTPKIIALGYGSPIKIRWTAPLNHSKKDWIGLYRVGDNASREVTEISSQGRWTATNKDEYNSILPDHGILFSDTKIVDANSQESDVEEHFMGEIEFSGDKLWWTMGVFEFRYHHDGKHTVMAISTPFEVRIRKFDEEGAEKDMRGLMRRPVEEALLHLVRICFDRDPDIAPRNKDDAFRDYVERNEKYAKRIVFAVHQM